MEDSPDALRTLGAVVQLVSGQHIEAAHCTTDSHGTAYLTGPVDFPAGRIVTTKYTRVPKVTCKPGDVLVTVKGSGTGKTVVADSVYCISRQLMAVRAVSCEGAYLHFLLESFAAGLRADASGLIPGISRSDLLSLRAVFPPLLEQRLIAVILATLNEAIRRTEQVIAKLQQIKRGLLHDLLTRGVDEHGELRPSPRCPSPVQELGARPHPKGVDGR